MLDDSIKNSRVKCLTFLFLNGHIFSTDVLVLFLNNIIDYSVVKLGKQRFPVRNFSRDPHSQLHRGYQIKRILMQCFQQTVNINTVRAEAARNISLGRNIVRK